jgi:hypothetical protein
VIKIGAKFGRLTVLLPARSDPPKYQRYYTCTCSCGRVKDIRGDNLKLVGGTRSCGCLQREHMAAKGNHYRRGRRFGRLTILREVGTNRRGMRYDCECKCGKRCVVAGRNLADGATRSCGCFYRDSRPTVNYRHGQSPSKKKVHIYGSYYHARGSCRNPNDKFWKYYGGRGIEFRFDSFEEWYSEFGDRPSPDHRLLRIDKEGHFQRGNVEWVLNKNAIKNKRKTS